MQEVYALLKEALPKPWNKPKRRAHHEESVPFPYGSCLYHLLSDNELLHGGGYEMPINGLGTYSSNWYVKELKEFMPQVTITPALVQNEIHPYYQENDVIPYIQDLGIVVQGWYPLGGRGHTAELLGDEVISAIAEDHGVSPAQVILIRKPAPTVKVSAGFCYTFKIRCPFGASLA